MRSSILAVGNISWPAGICEVFEIQTKIPVWWEVNPSIFHMCVLETELSLCLWRTKGGWGHLPDCCREREWHLQEDRQKNVGGRNLENKILEKTALKVAEGWKNRGGGGWHQCWLHLEWTSLSLLVGRKWMLSWEGNSGDALGQRGSWVNSQTMGRSLGCMVDL